MKFLRFRVQSVMEVLTGYVEADRIHEIEGNMYAVWNPTGRSFSFEEVTLEAPVIPNQIIGIGKNYIDPNEKMPTETPEIPVFFFKSTSSVIGTEAEIVLPTQLTEVKFESELAVVIGHKTKNINETDALTAVFGYTIANDVTAPQYFHPDGHWMVGKSFDTFTPIGPVIETDLSINEVVVQAYKNGEMKQNSSTQLMIVSVQKMIAYLSQVMTLMPGDVILTGSPVGAEFIRVNDVIECRIEGIGLLKNPVSQTK